MGIPSIPIDKIRGMLIGMAVGDAFGIRYEMDFDLRDFSPYISGQGLVTGKNGHVSYSEAVSPFMLSDASQVPLQLARTISTNPTYPWQRNNVINSYLYWNNGKKRHWSTPEFDKFFKNTKTVDGYDRKQTEESRKTLDKMQVNMSVLTRMIPMSIITDNKFALEEVKLTHFEPHVYDASILYCNILRLAMWDVRLHDINNKIIENAQYPVFKSVVNVGRQGIMANIGGKIRSACFIPFYIMGLLEHNNITTLSDALSFIVTNFQNADLRYLCSIIGALYGAMLGYSGLEQDPITSQNIMNLRSSQGNEIEDFDTLCNNLKQLSH